MRTIEHLNKLLREASKEADKWNTRVESLRKERKEVLDNLNKEQV